MKKFLSKATMLANMAAIRLNRPMATADKTEVKSLEAAIRAVAMLHKVVPILQTAQVLHHKRPVTSRGELLGDTSTEEKAITVETAKKKPLERLHNIHEQEWRVLRPGMERDTRHLRWRK